MQPRAPRRRRKHGVLFGALILVAGIAALAVFGITSTIYSKTRKLAGRMLMETAQHFREVEPLKSEEREALRTYRNAEHVERAESLGVSQVEDLQEADSLARRRLLVPLTDGPYYAVREMDYAIPYVTPSTRNLLDSLGIRFRQELERRGLPPYRFVITSATRTREAQQRLQGTNPNAAALSSHTFGTTVDLHYEDFEYAADQDSVPDAFWISNRILGSMLAENYSPMNEQRRAALKAILGRELRQMQREGSVLVIYERQQPVYHITLGAELSIPTTSRAKPSPAAQAAATAPPL